MPGIAHSRRGYALHVRADGFAAAASVYPPGNRALVAGLAAARDESGRRGVNQFTVSRPSRRVQGAV